MADANPDAKNDAAPQPPNAVPAPDAPPAQNESTEAPTETTNDAQGRPKSEKAEPINIVVRDQSGAGLQFKVRKNTKFEKVLSFSTPSCPDDFAGHVGLLPEEAV